MDAAQVALGAVVTTVFHPVGYAKVLIQLGHEPIAPQPTTTLFGKDVLGFPNVFKYIRHIKAVDGFRGLYRGLVPRVANGLVGTAMSNYTSELIKDLASIKEIEEEDDSSFKKFCVTTCRETAARCAGVIISQPFHVIMIRSMAQFVGRETVYNGVFSSIGEIWQKEGIVGFFSGLLPRLLCEAVTVWLSSLVCYVVNTYVIEDKDMKSYTNAACGLLVTHLTYPFTLVGNCMAVSGSGLKAGHPPFMPVYSDWYDCWSHLNRHGNLKRGSSLFFRYYKGPVIMKGGKPIAATMVFQDSF
ncbi:mitochondrial carrier homolog 2-like isoform X2 [Lineus longissimus]|uniref:mitochondrial carrier homolog 2-like isoform X2 n=1 Tax=Lineus longissimus TaxID=88925 RepID=UPI002B4D5213